MVSLTGFDDINVKTYKDEQDPYYHIRDAKYFSFMNLYFNDAWHPKDEDDHGWNETHGYLTPDDPWDTRNNWQTGDMLATFLLIVIPGFFIFVGYRRLWH